jgi:hypothetical protein
MGERMEENERLLRAHLEESGERRLVLSGGFAVARAEDGGVIVGRLPGAENRFEQLELDAIRTTEDLPKEGDLDERRAKGAGARGKARP